MMAWTTTTFDGRCSYDGTHTWRKGARVFVVQGKTWRKTYCASCALARHSAPADTGQELGTTDAPNYPAPLKAIADAVDVALSEPDNVVPMTPLRRIVADVVPAPEPPIFDVAFEE